MDRHMRGARSVISVWCVLLGCALVIGCLQVIAVGSVGIRFAASPSPVNRETLDLRAGSRTAPAAASVSRSTSASQLPAENFSAFRHAAKVYPYSIIPGGIASVKQLRNAVALDPLVAAQYASFNLATARMIRLNHERTVYVSYRKDERAYWTTRKLALRSGELLVTDGEHTARARCGNLISEDPVSPVSLGEPTPSTLDTPLTLQNPLIMDAMWTQGDPTDPGSVASFVPQQSIDSSDPGRDVFIPLIPFFFVPAAPPSAPPLPPDPDPVPPPVSVPEPSTLILLSTSLGVWFIRKAAARRAS